jgi:hypothetical protein
MFLMQSALAQEAATSNEAHMGGKGTTSSREGIGRFPNLCLLDLQYHQISSGRLHCLSPNPVRQSMVNFCWCRLSIKGTTT